jgi:hypothetical protein
MSKKKGGLLRTLLHSQKNIGHNNDPRSLKTTREKKNRELKRVPQLTM